MVKNDSHICCYIFNGIKSILGESIIKKINPNDSKGDINNEMKTYIA